MKAQFQERPAVRQHQESPKLCVKMSDLDPGTVVSWLARAGKHTLLVLVESFAFVFEDDEIFWDVL